MEAKVFGAGRDNLSHGGDVASRSTQDSVFADRSMQ